MPILFLTVRAAHVLLAAIWVGATFFITYFLFPSLQDAGPAGGPVMGALMRRKLPVFQASLGGAVVSKNARKMSELGARLPSAPEAERAALGAQMAAARQRAATAARIVIVLQMIAVVLMAIGHYV